MYDWQLSDWMSGKEFGVVAPVMMETLDKYGSPYLTREKETEYTHRPIETEYALFINEPQQYRK